MLPESPEAFAGPWALSRIVDSKSSAIVWYNSEGRERFPYLLTYPTERRVVGPNREIGEKSSTGRHLRAVCTTKSALGNSGCHTSHLAVPSHGCYYLDGQRCVAQTSGSA